VRCKAHVLIFDPAGSGTRRDRTRVNTVVHSSAPQRLGRRNPSIVPRVTIPAVPAPLAFVGEKFMGRGILLWLLGVPIPIILLLALVWR
jgi:hypothetical protein